MSKNNEFIQKEIFSSEWLINEGQLIPRVTAS